MRILWHSNAPWSSVGYGNQTRIFCPRLKTLGHEIAISAFFGLEGGVLNWNGIPVYSRGFHPYGMDVYAAHAMHFEADLIISLMDAWVFAAEANPNRIPWAPWYPVDMAPLPPPVAAQVCQAAARIVFSRFGERMTLDAGLDCIYVPHGVDTSMFKPGDRKAARQRLKVSDDLFIVGMVAANKGTPSRKCLAQSIEAFAALHKKHPDTLLYMHTHKAESGENSGLNLTEICSYFGLKEREDIVFCDPYINVLGFPDVYMVDAYNAMDVLLAVSMGEGFGIPIVEAQACGTPVIVGDWTSMSELCFSGWKVKQSEAEKFWTPLGAFQWLPHTGAIIERLEAAYHKAKGQDWRKDAREGALAYDADLITKTYWKPALETIAARDKDAGAMKLVTF